MAALTGFGAAAAAAGMPREAGVWFNQSKRGAVELRPCGDGHLCGYIVWLRQPNSKNGAPLTDIYNPKSSSRGRPICGLPVLGGLRPMSDGSWDRGWVYDPEEGKTYDAAIKLAAGDRIVMTGYKGTKMFSKSFTWKRAPANLVRCDDNGDPAPKLQEARLAPKPPKMEPLPPLPVKANLARASQLPPITPPRPVPAVRRSSAAARMASQP